MLSTRTCGRTDLRRADVVHDDMGGADQRGLVPGPRQVDGSGAGVGRGPSAIDEPAGVGGTRLVEGAPRLRRDEGEDHDGHEENRSGGSMPAQCGQGRTRTSPARRSRPRVRGRGCEADRIRIVVASRSGSGTQVPAGAAGDGRDQATAQPARRQGNGPARLRLDGDDHRAARSARPRADTTRTAGHEACTSPRPGP